jgi:hypothetical protein
MSAATYTTQNDLLLKNLLQFYKTDIDGDFNPDNNFPNQFNMPVFPVNDEAQFHANAFLQNLQQQPMQESNNVIQESNVINKIDTYIHSDEDDDVKDKIVDKEQIR